MAKDKKREKEAIEWAEATFRLTWEHAVKGLGFASGIEEVVAHGPSRRVPGERDRVSCDGGSAVGR